MKNKLFLILLCVFISMCFTGCSGKASTKIIEVPFRENTENNPLMDIFEYEFKSAWTDEQQKVIEKVKNYDAIHMQLSGKYMTMLNIIDTGINDDGGIWINLQENGYLVNHLLDMKYGFYESGFDKLGNEYDWRVWTSPDGNKRIVRGINKKTGKIYIEWQEIDGKNFCIAKDLEIADYDLQCVWAGNSTKVFLRILPNEIYPEKTMDSWNKNVSGYNNSSGSDEKIQITELKDGDIWMITRENGYFRNQLVYTMEPDETFKSEIKVSEDGNAFLLYMDDSIEQIFKEKGVKVRHTANYIEMNEEGIWNHYFILHFNSKVNYVYIKLLEHKIVAIKDDGTIVWWDPVSGEKILEKDVVTEEFQYCIYENNKDETAIYVATKGEIIRYVEADDHKNWSSDKLYISPKNSSVMFMKYDRDKDGLLVLYTLDTVSHNTQNFQTVFLQLKSKE